MDSGNHILKVAHFLPHYPALEGTTSFCRGLTRAINRSGRMVCPIISLKRVPPESHANEVILHYSKTSRNPLALPDDLARDILENIHGLDGMLLHGVYNPAVAAMRRLLKVAGIPYIFVPHDPYSEALRKHNSFRKLLFWHIFEKPTINNAAAVQLLDGSHMEYLEALGCTPVTEIIPNGCEIETSCENGSDVRIPGASSDIRIQYLGRMDRNHKGLDLLLRGFDKWKASQPDVDASLVLTGNDWHDRPQLQALANSLTSNEDITFTGSSTEPSLKILAAADLVVLASRFDGFGLCIVEAMLAARPVMVSDQAAVSRHVRESGGGWTVNPTVDSIAAGFQKAYDEKATWESKGLAGYEYVKTNLTWDQIALKTEKMYLKYFGRSV